MERQEIKNISDIAANRAITKLVENGRIEKPTALDKFFVQDAIEDTLKTVLTG